MSSNNIEIIVSIVFVCVCLLLPIGYVVWTGRWKSGALLTWACLCCFFLLGGIAGALYGVPEKESPYPSMIALGPALILGWLFGLVLAGFGMLARAILWAFCPAFARLMNKRDTEVEEIATAKPTEF